MENPPGNTVAFPVMTGIARSVSSRKLSRRAVTEGLYLNDQELVEAYVEGAPIILKELMDWGMKIFYYESAHFQEMARGAVTSGPWIMRALRKEVKKRKIQTLEDVMILELLKDGDRVVGAVGLNMNTGELLVIKARAVILATGGWQRAWSLTSAVYELTGDGQAMAYRAGAEMIDMEMIQTTPGNIIAPPRFRGYSSLYRLSFHIDAGRMINSKGERFMERYDPERLEHSSKEILSLGILSEVEAGRGSPNGGVWWSFKDVNKDLIRETVEKHHGKGAFFFEVGLSDLWERLLSEGEFEVGVAAHFMIGGIRVKRNAETSVRGLYAAGECSSNLWGATRVASACSQVCIQGMYAAKAAAESVKGNMDSRINWDHVESIQERTYKSLERKRGRSPIEVRKRIQRIADEKVNILRKGEKLGIALEELEKMRDEIEDDVAVQGIRTRRFNQEWIEALQLENLRQCLELTAASALHRKESRGAHYRADYQICDNDTWLKNIIIRREDGKRKIGAEPVAVTKLQPPGGTMTYQETLGLGLASIKAKKEAT
jgi:succinate dehydrogenase/fumarate reductase flavoprotein subunit